MSSIASLQSRLHQLLEEKNDGKRVDNALHDTGIELAQLLLSNEFPNRSWTVSPKNKRGIDVRGYVGDKLDVACEVTTHDFLEGNRRQQIRDDLARLRNSGAQNRFLAIVHAEILVQLRRMRSKGSLEGLDVIYLPANRFERLTK